MNENAVFNINSALGDFTRERDILYPEHGPPNLRGRRVRSPSRQREELHGPVDTGIVTDR